MAARSAVSVQMSTVLYQTEAPEIVLCRDRIGAAYLCCLVALREDGLQYLAVQIYGDRLAALRSGSADLRTVLAEPEMSIHFDGRTSGQAEGTVVLTPLETVPPESWLPAEGFLLNEVDTRSPHGEISNEAIAKNSAVIVYRIDPPEARGIVSRVDADRLVAYVRAFQELVKRAGTRALIGLGSAAKKALGDEPFSLRVFAFSPGSFNVHFEATDTPDLFGASATGAAMREIDRLVEISRLPPDEALNALGESKGHLLGAYYDLMRLVSKQNVAFSYRWSEPGLSVPRGGAISVTTARAVVALLEKEDTLKSEPFAFHARFTSVKTEPGPSSWVARDDEGKKRQGFVHEDYESALDGVRIRSVRYLLTGIERLVSSPKGEPSLKLFLTSAEVQEVPSS